MLPRIARLADRRRLPAAAFGSLRLNRPPPAADIGRMEPYDLICLGCGPAGEKAATQAAYFKHRRTRQAHDLSHAENAQGEGRQHDRGSLIAAKRWEPAQVDRKDDDQN